MPGFYEKGTSAVDGTWAWAHYTFVNEYIVKYFRLSSIAKSSQID